MAIKLTELSLFLAMPSPAETIQSAFANNPCLVIDVGARDGFSLLRGLHHIIDLHAIEPDPAAASELKNATSGPFRKRTVHELALADYNGEAILHVARHGSMSSLLKTDHQVFFRGYGLMKNAPAWSGSMEVEHEIAVNALMPEAFLAQIGAEYVDLLKLDTQGNELDILRCSRELLQSGRVGVICTEVALMPIYKDQGLFSDIDVFLRSCGFTLVDFRVYPEMVEREDEFAFGKKMYERPKLGASGDAWYVFDPGTSDTSKSRRTRSAIILASEGYFSEAAHILNGIMNPDEQNSLFRHLYSGSKEMLKHLYRRWTPMAMRQWVAKLKKR